MIVLVQKQIGHEPDTWEDVKIPKSCIGRPVGYLAEQYRILQQAGLHRIFMSDGTIYLLRSYPITEWVVTIDGEIQNNASQ